MVSRVRAVSGGSVVVGQLLGWVLKKPGDYTDPLRRWTPQRGRVYTLFRR